MIQTFFEINFILAQLNKVNKEQEDIFLEIANQICNLGGDTDINEAIVSQYVWAFDWY